MAMKRFQDVDAYIKAHPDWADGLTKLRKLCLDTEMEETVKWGAPHYTIKGKNVVGIAAFKNHFALWFHQGAFLSDPDQLLYNAQEGKTKGLRQIRFTDQSQIKTNVLKKYVREAIENEKKGRSIQIAKPGIYLMPQLLKTRLQKDPNLQNAFDELTPGKQKEFAEYLNEAKREETKIKRLEKIIPLIRNGIGLNDKYRK